MIGLLTLLLATAPAHAQFVDCGNSGGGFAPIAGTSGLANTRAALTTNRVTYAASTFAERRIFEQLARADASPDAPVSFQVAFEQNVTYSVTHVPVIVDQDRIFHPEDCPEELWGVAMSPVDLQAQNLGFGVRKGHFGAFYSSSLTFGTSAIPNDMNRIMIWSGAMTFYGPALLLAAPLSGGWVQDSGASAFAIDWIGGVFYDGEPIRVRAGYAGGSQGFYASASEPRTAAFVSVNAGAGGLTTLRAGIDRFDVGLLGAESVGRVIGTTTAFYRELPYAEPTVDTSGGQQEATPSLGERLRSGHFQQEDIAQIVDLRFGYTLQPIVTVSELAVGLHNPGYTPQRDAPQDQASGGGRITVGQVTIPDMYTLGVEGGSFLMVDLEVGASGTFEGGAVGGYFGLQVNHPDQLALYPFARGAVSYRYSLQGTF
jgi:hypothetical protein